MLEELSPRAERQAAIVTPFGARFMAAVLAFFILAASPLGYLLFGTPAALQSPALPPAAQPVTTEQIEKMVGGLAARLESMPDDLEGWRMLARSQHVLGRYEKAAQAYARVLALGGRNADVLARYADSVARANDGRIDGDPYRHIKEALALDPKHGAALAMAGHAEAQRGNYAAAADLWERLMKQLPPSSEIAPMVQELIDNARRHAAQTPRGSRAVEKWRETY